MRSKYCSAILQASYKIDDTHATITLSPYHMNDETHSDRGCRHLSNYDVAKFRLV